MIIKSLKNRILSIFLVGSMSLGISIPAYGFFGGRTRNFLGLVFGAGSCLAIGTLFAKRFFSTVPARSTHDQRLLAAGVPEYMLPYVKDATKVGNVSYIHLEAVNQFDVNVNAPVDTYQKEMIKKEKEEHKVTEISDLPQEKKDRIESFSSTGTCAIQAIRVSELMNRLIRLQNHSKIWDMIDKLLGRPDRKIEILELLRDPEDAQAFLQREVDDNLVTSWLSGGDLENRIKDNNARYGLEDGSIDVQEVSSFIETDGPEYLKGKLAPRGPYNGGDFQYTFIICTGDVERLQAVDSAYNELLGEYNIPNFQERLLLKDQEGNKTAHYYVVTMVKEGDDVKYYIVDTLPTNDHINNAFFLNRNRYFCDILLTNRSTIIFRTEVRNYAKRRLTRLMKRMSLNGNLKFIKKRIKNA